MKKRVIITKEQKQKMDEEFIELYSRFRPEAHNSGDIQMLNRIKNSIVYRRLKIRNAGNHKKETFYSNRLYNEQIRVIPIFQYYYKNKQQQI